MTRVFGLLSALPPSLRGVVLDIEWDRERLWALDLPTVVLPVAELRWHLALPLWRDDEGPFRVTPKEVLAERSSTLISLNAFGPPTSPIPSTSSPTKTVSRSSTAFTGS